MARQPLTRVPAEGHSGVGYSPHRRDPERARRSGRPACPREDRGPCLSGCLVRHRPHIDQDHRASGPRPVPGRLPRLALQASYRGGQYRPGVGTASDVPRGAAAGTPDVRVICTLLPGVDASALPAGGRATPAAAPGRPCSRRVHEHSGSGVGRRVVVSWPCPVISAVSRSSPGHTPSRAMPDVGPRGRHRIP